MQTRNSKVLASFVAYCNKYPEQRFWQALTNWSGFRYIIVAEKKPNKNYQKDTFYFEGKDK